MSKVAAVRLRDSATKLHVELDHFTEWESHRAELRIGSIFNKL